MARSLFCPRCKSWIDTPKGWTYRQTRKRHEEEHQLAETHPDLLAMDLYLENMYGDEQ